MANWLSDRVPSTLAIAHELTARAESTTPTRLRRLIFTFGRFLDECEIRGAIGISIFVLIVYSNAVIWHTEIAGPATHTQYDSSITQIISGLVPILIAIVVFSAQLHASRTDEGAFAVQYLVRTHRVFPILALGIGITMANVGATIAPTLFNSLRLEAISWLNIVFVPLILLLGLWLTWITLRDAARSNFDPAMPLFRRDMRFALAETTRRRRMSSVLQEVCKERGLNYGWPTAGMQQLPSSFSVSNHGTIVDVNLDALKQLARLIRPIAAEYDAFLNVTIGQGDIDMPVLKFAKSNRPKPVQPNNYVGTKWAQDAKEPDAKSSIERLSPRIQSSLDAAIKIQANVAKGFSQALSDFLLRYGMYLRELAQDRRAPRLRNSLKRLEEITSEWAKAAPEAALGTQLPWFQSVSDVFNGPLSVDLHDAALAAIRSEDESTMDAFLSFADRLAMFAVREHLPVLLHEIGGLIQFMYYQAVLFANLDAYCTRRFDVAVYHLLVFFKARQHPLLSDHAGVSAYEQERACLDQALWIVLNLIKTSIERNRTIDARHFMDRLFNHNGNESHDFIWNEIAPESDSVATLHDYVRFVLAGWCAAHIAKHPDKCEAAAAVLEKIPASQISILRLMGVWELYRSNEIYQAPIDYRLGVAHWNPEAPQEFRVGVANPYWGDGHWIHRGLHALLLHAQGTNAELTRRYFPNPPPQSTWNEQQSRKWLEELIKLDSLSIPENNRAERIESVLRVIRQRQNSADQVYVEKAITQPIDQTLWTEFVMAVEAAWRSHRLWIDAINSLCATLNSPNTVSLDRVGSSVEVSREFLIPGNNYAGGFGEILGEPLAIREAQSLLWLAQETCPKGENIKEIALIADHVRQAVQQLQDQGFHPNLIILPQADRFGCSLFNMHRWLVPGHNKFGEASLGQWENLLVLRWPYLNADFVMIADSCRLFGKKQLDGKQIDVLLTDLSVSEQKEQLMQLSQKITNGESISSNDVKVLVEAWLNPEYGINEPKAALLLNLNESDGSYALPTSDLFYYHRTTCDEIKGDKSIKLSLSKRLDGEHTDRQPCPKCRPNLMDFEAISSVGKAQPRLD